MLDMLLDRQLQLNTLTKIDVSIEACKLQVKIQLN